MLLNTISHKNNFNLISEKYVGWLNTGAMPHEILVLTFNALSKKNILKNILNSAKNSSLSDIKIYTLGGLFYNSVIDNWHALENAVPDNNTKIIPSLNGMEVSQYVLKNIIKDVVVKGYNSKKSLLHQIFRRYSLIVNNNLSPDMVKAKSDIIGESFADDAEKIIQNFMAQTLHLRSFDNIRQTQIFNYIFKNTRYFDDIKYLIADDCDEFPPIIFDFFEHIAPQLKDKFLIFDKDGGSRRGFLCAEPCAAHKLQEIFNENISGKTCLPQNILSLQNNILLDEQNVIDNLKFFSLSKRVDMVEKAVNIINDLLLSGVKPNDISVVTPIQDDLLKYTLISELKLSNPVFISGSEKLSDNRLVKIVISILKLSLSMPLDEYELRAVLSEYAQVPIKNSKKILQHYRENNTLIQVEFENEMFFNNYSKFLSLLDKLKASSKSLSEKAYFIYLNYSKKTTKLNLHKFNFFLKELQDFENISGFEGISPENILVQLENSIISENPYYTPDIKEDELVIATPQKIIDFKHKTKYQFWLDVSSSEWIKSDTGPLYNSWVFQKSWSKDSYSVDDNINLSKEKISKVLRKLMLNTDYIYAFSSLFDTQGIENMSGIEQFLIQDNVNEEDSSANSDSFIPRDDQKPVLKYSSGKMAVSAVPGAGKTTVLLALIVKLLNDNVNPDNIYVLTYMESAARNFKDRIKSLFPSSNKLPNISTIHGLALRILKENSNYERIGLSHDFEICDDSLRGNILKALFKSSDKSAFDEFDRGISIVKLNNINLNSEISSSKVKSLNDKNIVSGKSDLKAFIKFFDSYQSQLKQNNLIDYDDILILAVKLLEENNDICQYYQNICHYIIEDEAQDSSSIQQKLISILSAKHKNLIRCGDINQAITTTFTSADVDGFKKFISNSTQVNMSCSQRCSKGVWELANKLVKYGNSVADKPFYEIFMQPVSGKNPVEKNPVVSNIYDNPQNEKLAVVKNIKKILADEPNATIGLLLRNNYQVNLWADFLNSFGLSTISRNESLGQNKIFKVILSILNFIDNPFDNLIVADAYKTLAECGFFKIGLEKNIVNFSSNNDFITIDNDKITESNLARFHWDMNYWLSFPELSVQELAMRIGFNYFSGSIDKSNIYLISTLCAKLNSGNFNYTIQRLNELSKKTNLSGFKFFADDDDLVAEGKIQIMTLHKSKGDEFDYVFLPEMSEKNLTLDISQINLKKSNSFEENIKRLNKNYKPKSDYELKQLLINENFRLLYVAITRAKKRIYFSASNTEIYFNKIRKAEPSIIFAEFL